MTVRRAVILDRDGTLTHDTGYTFRVADFRLLDNAVAGLRLLASLSFQLIIATNQSGIARGLFSEADMHRYNEHLLEALRGEGLTVAGIYYCPFHPEGIGCYRRDSELRKPAPGMLRLAAREHQLDLSQSYVIGDKKSDILAGQAAGCRTFLVRTGHAGQGEPELTARPNWIVADVLEAARVIESLERTVAAPGEQRQNSS